MILGKSIVFSGRVLSLGINQAKGEHHMTSISFFFFPVFLEGNADESYLLVCQRFCYLMENLWSALFSGQESERQKSNKPNKKPKIDKIIVIDMFYIDLQHAVTVLGDKTEPE